VREGRGFLRVIALLFFGDEAGKKKCLFVMGETLREIWDIRE